MSDMHHQEPSFGMTEARPEAVTTGRTSDGVVHVAGRDWAVGLMWNTVDSPSKAGKEARAMAETDSIRASYYCVRTRGTFQYGLGFRDSNHRAGMPSLAAQLADAVGGSWVGAFAVSGGFYLIGIRDDGILSGWDKLVVSEDEAREAFQELLLFSDWDAAYAPAEFGIERTEERDLESFLSGRPNYRLTDTRRTGSLLKLGVLVALAAAVFGGATWYIRSERMLDSQKNLQEIFNNAVKKGPVAAVTPSEEIPPMPWEGKAVGASFLATCVSEMQSFQFSVPGWTTDRITCRDRIVEVELSRDGALEVNYGDGTGPTAGRVGGTINWIAPLVNKEGFHPSIFPNGDKATIAWAMPATETHPIDVKTATIGKVQGYLISQLEEVRTRVRFVDGKETKYFRSLKFSFTVPYDPLAYSQVLARIPALVLTKVSLDAKAWRWTIEGQINEQLPLPANAAR